MLTAIGLALVIPPVARDARPAKAIAVARARIIAAPRLDLRSPPKQIAGAQRNRRTIDFE